MKLDKKPEQARFEEEQDFEEGATIVEYALLAALIAVVCIASITFVGGQASQVFRNIGLVLGGGAGS